MRLVLLLFSMQAVLFSHGDNHSHIESDGTGTVNGNYVGPNVTYYYFSFNLADMEGVNLSGADLTGCTFVGADLTNANLSGANLTNASFKYADLTNANLDGANLLNANLSSATLTNVSIEGLVSLTQDTDSVEVNWATNSRLKLKESTDLNNWTEVSGVTEGGVSTHSENGGANNFYKLTVN